MERSVWTDERIDDMVDRLSGDIADLREEIQADRRELRAEMAALRREIHTSYLVLTTAILSLAGIMAAHSL